MPGPKLNDSGQSPAPAQCRSPPTLVSTHYRRRMPTRWRTKKSKGKRFLDLPAEIRNAIYDYALCGLAGFLVKHAPSEKQPGEARYPITLLLTSKRVYCEAHSMLLWNNWVHTRYNIFDLLAGSEWDHLRMLVIEWEQKSGPAVFALAARMPNIRKLIFRACHFSFRQLKGVLESRKAFPKLESITLMFTDLHKGQIKWYGERNEKLHPAIQLRFGLISKDEFLEWKWFKDMCEYFEKCQRFLDQYLQTKRPKKLCPCTKQRSPSRSISPASNKARQEAVLSMARERGYPV